MAEWISEFRLISIIYSKGPGNLLHPLPVGKKIYSTEPGNRLREGKYLLHDMGNLLRHSRYAQVLISQPLSSPSALCYHNLFHIRARDLNFCPPDVYVSPLVLVVLGFAAYTLYGRVRGGHRIAFCTPRFAPPTSIHICGGHCLHLCHSTCHLDKAGYTTRVRAICRTQRSHAVAAACSKSLRKTCAEVIRKKGAATRG